MPFADGVAQLVHRSVIAEVLGEFVVQLRKILAADALHRGVKLHGLSGQAGSAVVFRIGNFKLLFVSRREPEQVRSESLEGIAAADFEHGFVLLDRLAFHAFDALERYHRMIALGHRPRIDVHIFRLGLADLGHPLIHVLVGHFGIVVGHFHVVVFLQLDRRNHFEFGLECQGFAVVKMDVGNIRAADHTQIFRLNLFLQMGGDQALQYLMPDVAGKLLSNQGSRGFARAEPGEFGAFLNLGGHPAGFALHLVNGNGKLQRMPATFY